jgi:rRNA-processing protein FCF1
MTKNPNVGRRRVQVILDSNALLVPFQFNIDVFEELKRVFNTNPEVVLLSPVKKELERLAEYGSPKMRKQAVKALRLVEKCPVKDTGIDPAAPVDDVILRIAKERKIAVFTNDRALRKRLRDINVPVVYVREKSHLEIEGRI